MTITRSKAEQLVKDFVKEHNLDAEECPPYFEGLMYFRFVVEEEYEEEDENDDLFIDINNTGGKY